MKNSNKITILTAAVLLAASGGAFANTYTVTTDAGSGACSPNVVAPGCSLGGALLAAEANAGVDTIKFSDSLPSIVLGAFNKPITHSVIIDGKTDSRSRTELNAGSLPREGLYINNLPVVTGPMSAWGTPNAPSLTGTSSGLLAVVPGNATINGVPGFNRGCNNGTDPTITSADVSGKIAVVARGVCTFRVKMDVLKAAGAVGVVILNNANGNVFQFNMSGLDRENGLTATIVANTTAQTLQNQNGQPAILYGYWPHIFNFGVFDFLSTFPNAASTYATVENMVINGAPRDAIRFFDFDNGTVKNSFLGTDISGMNPMPNAGCGVRLENGAGKALFQDNVISANDVGICVNSGKGHNQFLNNKIGVAADGVTAMGNNGNGIWIFEEAPYTLIKGNIISANGQGGSPSPGIAMPQGTKQSNAIIQQNSIYGNGIGARKIGIDLGANFSTNGITLNDPLDGDNGANHLQNFPVLNAKQSMINTQWSFSQGTLSSEANTSYRIEVYADDASNAVCLPVSNPNYESVCGAGQFLSAQGKYYLGSVDVTTDSNGNAFWDKTQFENLLSGSNVVMTSTATKLDISGNPIETSEFSEAIDVREVGSQTAYQHAVGAGNDNPPAPVEPTSATE